jgi:lipoprotein-releasing system permease protein
VASAHGIPDESININKTEKPEMVLFLAQHKPDLSKADFPPIIDMRLILMLINRLNRDNHHRLTRLMLRLAIGVTACGIAAILLSYAIVGGFQTIIPDKFTSFSGHVQVQKMTQAQDFESDPIAPSEALIDSLHNIYGVERLAKVGYKAAIAHNKEEFEGILLKGIDKDYPQKRFGEWLTQGKLPQQQSSEGPVEVLVPESLARRLKLMPGDKLKLYFIQNPIRARSVVVSGIYRLGIEAEFGRPILIGPLDLIRKINDWSPEVVGQIEMHLTELAALPSVVGTTRNIIDPGWEAYSIKDRFANLFGWLGLFDLNKKVMLLIMLLVCGVNILSALLIFILERIPSIGLLKSLGMDNARIRLMFVMAGLFTCLKGLLWGNLAFWLIYLAQNQWKLMPLDEENYYVDAVPMHLPVGEALGINAVVILSCLLLCFAASWIIGKIEPVHSMRFD